ncbi:hypothetical protein CFC21_080350 [Triticum aestivum]|uniref:Uncharacterized protein n=2 Tax=Triticum aestivum TaxID=4565 RepID=A0A9R1I2Y5_WHEAT|nr:hypothetical protein CFC21_080350 [Triticum aestivum]
MWACRSFLRRPNRHDANQRTAHGTNHLTASPRRHVSDAANRDPHHPAAAAAATTKRHLYVVLDDHKHEYGIYKLDVGGDLDGDHDPDSARRLPDPAVIRVEVPTAVEDLAARFAALGSCIITTGSSPNTYGPREEHYGVTLVYDTQTAALSVACNVPKGLRDGFSRGRRAGYDGELDAWVGLHRKGYDTDGHLCVCRVPVPTSDLDRTPQPQWKVGGEKVLLEHKDWRHVDAKLVHMVERGEHCLVERLRREGTDETECLPDGDECLLRLTTFQVKYGDDGELITTADRAYARSYKMSRYRDDFEVAAFWI